MSYPIFIISLDDAVERRQALLDRLDAAGLDYEVVSAVDGRRGLPGELRAEIDPAGGYLRTWRHLTDAEWACALSHRKVYDLVAERGLDGAVVLEDDAILKPGFETFVRDEVYRRHEMTLLDHVAAQVWPGRPEQLMDGVRALRVSTPPYVNTGYALSARAAAWIRRRSTPLSGAADWPCNIARLDCVAVMPRLVEQPQDETKSSDIEADRSATQAAMTAPRFASLRRLTDGDRWFEAVGKRIGRPLYKELERWETG